MGGAERKNWFQRIDKEAMMKLRRSKFTTKIIVFALVIYAGTSLFTLRARIENEREERNEVRRAVAEQELINAELEYQIENYNDPDVKAGIARSNLGLVLQGETVFYADESELDDED